MRMSGALFILQAGAAAALATPAADAGPPTIQLHARVQADRIKVEREGEASLTVYADPVLAKAIHVDRSKPVPNGATVKNVEVVLDAQATIDPNGGPVTATATATATATGEPQP
jgi:hypothetical protein